MCMGVRHLPRDFQGPDRELHHWTNSLSYTYRPILGFGVQIYRDGEDLTEIRQRPSPQDQGHAKWSTGGSWSQGIMPVCL